MYQYRPPDSDSNSDDEDFEIYFTGDGKKSQKPEELVYEDQVNDLIYSAVEKGDLKTITELRNANSHYQLSSIDSPLRQGWSLLQYASYFGHLDVANYLITEGADVNKQIDNLTPIILACDSANTAAACPVVQLLLQHGAFINVADRNGTTPLMNAIKRGYTDIVNLIIREASKEAADIFGKTAIFYAVEQNNKDIVSMLISHGAVTNAISNNGSTPKEEAARLGFQTIVDLFPDEVEEYIIPSEYRHYTNYEDLAPTVFLNKKFPNYFQEIGPLLYGMKMEKYLGIFAKSNISLDEFLTISDHRLEEIGLSFPFQRNRIHLGLMKFHVHRWHKSSITKVARFKTEDTFDFFLIMCGNLKHFIVMNTTLQYITTNEFVAKRNSLNVNTINQLIESVHQLKKFINSFENNVKYIQTFNSPEPLLRVNLHRLNRLSSIFGTFTSNLPHLALMTFLIWAGLKAKRICKAKLIQLFS